MRRGIRDAVGLGMAGGGVVGGWVGVMVGIRYTSPFCTRFFCFFERWGDGVVGNPEGKCIRL